VKSGRLNQRFVVHVPVKTEDVLGGRTTVYEERGAIWGRVRIISAKDHYYTDRIYANARLSVRCRAHSYIVQGCRLVGRERTLQVLGIEDPELAGKELDLYCSEVTSGG
jgi:head-tail adaptor